MIKNIVFDIGNVILNGYASDCLENYDFSEENKKLIKEQVFENKEIYKTDLGEMTLAEFYDSIASTLPEKIRESGREVLLNVYRNRPVNKEIMSLIKTLYERKYSLYILSDNNLDVYHFLKKGELGKYMNGWCISAAYHATKDNAELFPIFMKEFQLKPEECYFIDDKESNIEKAKAIGMNGFVLDWKENTYEKLIQDLEEKIGEHL